jgi:hypothetical protein
MSEEADRSGAVVLCFDGSDDSATAIASAGASSS